MNNCFPIKYNFWDSQNIRHSDVGGVTSNKFRMGWSTQGDFYGPVKGFHMEHDTVSRTLIAVTKTMEAGIPCESPHDNPSLEGCFNLDRHIYSRSLSGVFCTPFQLSCTKWVRRKLTSGEIGSAMDLPVCSIKSFSLAAQITPK